MLVASAITIRNHSSIWRVLTPLASATSGSTDDSSSGRCMSAIRAILTAPRAAIDASTAELRDQLPRHHHPATQRGCAYRLGCVAEITAFLTVDLSRFGLPARIRP
jgi:hypothetical protein